MRHGPNSNNRPNCPNYAPRGKAKFYGNYLTIKGFGHNSYFVYSKQKIMKNKSLILVLSLLILSMTYSCKDKADDKETSQMQKVLAIHDEVMPKMGTIGKLVGELDQKIENNAHPENLITAREDLKSAHKAMMDWMKGFGNRFDGDEIMKGKALTEEKQKWLDEEEIKVNELRDHINSSIKKAEELLK